MHYGSSCGRISLFLSQSSSVLRKRLPMNIGKRLFSRPIGPKTTKWQAVGSQRKMHAFLQLPSITHQNTSFPSSQWLKDCIHRSSLSPIFNFATLRPFARLSLEYNTVELENPILGNTTDTEVCDMNMNNHIWQSSTMKKRRAKMNKHKIKKRKKDLKMNTKSSRA